MNAGDTPPDAAEAANLVQATEGPGRAVRRAPRVAAIILAAGRSARMGPVNKLLADLGGAPMIVRVADAVEGSRAEPLIVVTDHQRDRVEAALAGRNLTLVYNPDHATGLGSSLRQGVAALPDSADGAVIVLGDMPRVSSTAIDRLIAAFAPLEGRAICVPTWRGKRGNPVLFARRFFAEMQAIAGDVGARSLIGRHRELVCEVAMADDGVLGGVDTPEALAALRSAR